MNEFQALGKKEFNQILNTQMISKAYMYYHGRCFGYIGHLSGSVNGMSWLVHIDWRVWSKIGEPTLTGLPLDRSSYGFSMFDPPKFVQLKLLSQKNASVFKACLRKVGMLQYNAIEYLLRTYGTHGNDHIVFGRTDTLIGMDFDTAYKMYCRDLVKYEVTAGVYSSTAGSDKSFKYSISRAVTAINDSCYTRERQRYRKQRAAAKINEGSKTDGQKKKQQIQMSALIEKATSTTAKISEEVKKVTSDKSRGRVTVLQY